MTEQLQRKIDQAIRLLKAYDNPDEPVEIAYSGGKDSDVILQLAKEAGINFRAIYKNTTIDPPGTIKHAQEMGVEIIRPKKTFFQLIAEKGYPSRNKRFCCDELKEYKILDKCVQGIRREESWKRAERYKEPSVCRIFGRKENRVEVVLPILEWTKQDVAEFIADRGIKCAPVYYDENGNFHAERRLGCMGCPLAYRKQRIKVFKQHPGLVRCYIKAGRKFLETHPGAKSQKYGDVYSLFYRKVFCENDKDYFYQVTGLFGKPDIKGFLEKQFGITL